jgi:hypothetical protein
MAAEIARVDASCSTFFLVHSSLCMATIGMYVCVYFRICHFLSSPSIFLNQSYVAYTHET